LRIYTGNIDSHIVDFGLSKVYVYPTADDRIGWFW